MVKPGVSVFFRGHHLETVFLNGGEIRIGRHRGNDIVLDNRDVSRHHARIILEAGRYVLEDLESANGTRLNHAPTDRDLLSYGDEILIGMFTLVFQLLDPRLIADARQPPGDAGEGGESERTMLLQGEDGASEEPAAGARPSILPSRGGLAAPEVPSPKQPPREIIASLSRMVLEEEDADLERPPTVQPGRQSAPRAPFTPGHYALHVVKEGGVVLEKPLKRKSFSIGRSEGNDLILGGAEISRYHASITETPDGLQIEDVASRNGTRVNGAAISRQILAPGDKIQVGKYTLVLVRSEAPPVEKVHHAGGILPPNEAHDQERTERVTIPPLTGTSGDASSEAPSVERAPGPGRIGPTAPASYGEGVAPLRAPEAVEMSLTGEGWILDQRWPVAARLRPPAPGSQPNMLKIRLCFRTYTAEMEIPLAEMKRLGK